MIATLIGILAAATTEPQAANVQLQRIAQVLNATPATNTVTFRNAVVVGNMLSADMVSSVPLDLTTSEAIGFVRKGFCANPDTFGLRPGSPVELRFSLFAPHFTYPIRASVRAADCAQSGSDLGVANQPPPPPEPVVARRLAAPRAAGSTFDFKGVPLGISYEDFRRLPHPDGERAQVACTGEKVSSREDLRVSDDVEEQLGVRRCIWVGVDGDGGEVPLRIAGTAYTTIAYSFAFVPDPKDGVLRLFKFRGVSIRGAEPVAVDALTAKYGKGKINTGTVQNGFGNHFEQVSAEWSSALGSITAIAPATTTSDMAIIMTDKRLSKFVDDRRATKRAAVPNGI